MELLSCRILGPEASSFPTGGIFLRLYKSSLHTRWRFNKSVLALCLLVTIYEVAENLISTWQNITLSSHALICSSRHFLLRVFPWAEHMSLLPLASPDFYSTTDLYSTGGFPYHPIIPNVFWPYCCAEEEVIYVMWFRM